MPNAHTDKSSSGSSSSEAEGILTGEPTSSRGPSNLLAKKVNNLEAQVGQILSLLQDRPEQAPVAPATTPGPDAPAADLPAGPGVNRPSAHSVYGERTLQFTLPAPTAQGISDTLAIRQLYGETGKLNLFQKPPNLPQFPAQRFIPEQERLFGRIKDADARDGWEAEVLWNIGHNTETALASAHKVAETLANGDTSAATEAFSVLQYFLQASYERVQERVDFFADSVESGKSEAVLLQRYLLEQDQPYVSELYRDTKERFAELRSQPYAKEFNKQAARNSGTQATGRTTKSTPGKPVARYPPRGSHSGAGPHGSHQN